jgi:glutathione peroxidase
MNNSVSIIERICPNAYDQKKASTFAPINTEFNMRILIFIALGLSCVLLFACMNKKKVSASPLINTNMTSKTFYDQKINTLYGEAFDLSQFKGKKVVVMNVASKCGYTPQYGPWQQFYEANKDHVVVVGVPSNDFMAQEPGSAAEIGEFCQKNYGVTFPMCEKVVVKGDNKAPLYQWLTNPSLNGWNKEEPSWNFCKYLIDEEGKLTHFFNSKITPDSQEFLVALGL